MIHLIAGARPNFTKIAPIVRELRRQKIPYKIIHTGQHYDYEMSESFLGPCGQTSGRNNSIRYFSYLTLGG